MVDPVHATGFVVTDLRPSGALDLSWTFSLSRAPGSDALAARMSRSALETIGAPGARGRQVSEAVELACGYVVRHGLARRYRVTLGLDGPHCAVAVTDYGYDQPGEHWQAATDEPAPSRELSALCRVLSERMEGVQVHHASGGAVLVRFRTDLPLAGAPEA